MNIIDLNDHRPKDTPDADCVMVDDDGVTMYRYALEYSMGRSRWSAEIWAYSMEDAQNRVDAMRQSLVLLGQTHAIIPA